MLCCKMSFVYHGLILMDAEWLDLGRVFVKSSEILEETRWHFFHVPLGLRHIRVCFIFSL